MKTVILDGSAANPGDLSWEPFEKFGEVAAYDTTSPSQLLQRLSDADIAITNKTVFDASALSALPSLKYIGVLATGYNVVDLKAARAHGITVTNVPEYATAATAQMTIALLLELADKVAIHDAAVHAGEWCRSPQFCFFKSPLTELEGKTLHIVGFGKIGSRVASIAAALGMKVTATPHRLTSEKLTSDNGSVVTALPLLQGLENADAVSLHCPLTEETSGLINSDTLKSFKPGSFLINCARGPVVNEASVASALESGMLGGYAADVVSAEPMLESNPLLKAPNCVLTPHIAWAPVETRARLIDMAASNVEAWIAGDPINVVN